MGAEFSALRLEEQTLIVDIDWKFPCPVRYGIRLPKGLHPAELPAGTNFFHSLLEVYIGERGRHRFLIPLKKS